MLLRKRTVSSYMEHRTWRNALKIVGNQGQEKHIKKCTQRYFDGFGRWEYEIRTPRLKLWISHQFRGPGVLFGSFFSRKHVKQPHTNILHGFWRPGNAKFGFLGPDYGFHTKSGLQACTPGLLSRKSYTEISRKTRHTKFWGTLSEAPHLKK